MPDASPKGIGGWLIVYSLWAVLGIGFAGFTNFNDWLLYKASYPILLPAGSAILILVAIFYGFYSWLLYRLLRVRKGIIKPIKRIIIATPIFNAALPAIFAIIMVITVPGTELGKILAAAYTAPIIGSIAGATVMAFVWHRYFSVSRRVANTWPEG